MRHSSRSLVWICAFSAAALASASHRSAAAPAPRGFDLVTYTPPEGFTVDDSNPDHVAISRVGTKSYCLIGIYKSAAASGDLDASFAVEWQAVVTRSVDPVAAPAPTPGNVGAAHAVLGGAMSTAQGHPVFALLTVIDAGQSVVSILVMTPSLDDFKVYSPSVEGLLKSIAVRRVEASTPAPADDGAAAGGATTAAPGEVPAPGRALKVADLVGMWKHDDHAMTSYVNASTGSYAGFDSIATKESWTISAKGQVNIDFWGVTSGNSGTRGISEKHVASISISADNVLSIKYKKGDGADQQYLIRGWLVGAELTVLKINGPWYAPDGVPDDVRRDPHKGWNLDQYWVRASKPGAR